MIDRSGFRALTSQEWAAQKGALLPSLNFQTYCAEYRRLAAPWVSGGYNVLPGHNKRPAPGIAVGRGVDNLGRPQAPRATEELVRRCLKSAWLSAGGGPGRGATPPEPLLWPASHPDWPLVVFDADNHIAIAWGWKHFGPPNVLTRKGAHWYFVADPECPVTSCPVAPVEGAKGDVKGWCGLVVAPGGLGGVYEETEVCPSGCLDFPYELFGQLKTKDSSKRRRHGIRTGVVSYAPGEDIDGDTLVKRAGGEVVKLEECEGKRIHAPFRLDRNPSATVSRWTDGRLTVWDPGAKAGKGGTRSFVNEKHKRKLLAEARGRFGVDPTQPTGTPLLQALQQQGVNAMPCPRTPDGRFVDVAPADGITIVIAGHGLGKTYSAKRFFQFDESLGVLTVTNTTFLAEANAQRFGLTSYLAPDALAGSRLSTTLESLPRFDLLEPDVFLIDEADAVLGFLFSAVCSQVVPRFASLRKRVRNSPRVVITSADLDFDHVLTFLSWVKPDTPVRVFVDVPKPGARYVNLVSTRQAKRDLWDYMSERTPGKGSPVAVGMTERSEVSALAEMFGGQGFRCGWLSADNSKLMETIEKVKNIDQYLSEIDVLFFSPTLQSGVSIQTPVSRVFVIHTIQGVDVEVVAQMAMRFRNPECTTITWGLRDWQPQISEYPIESGALNLHLEQLETDMHQVSLLGIRKIGVPNKASQHDLELVRAWRTVERRARSSFRDTGARVLQVCKGHGWVVQDSRDYEIEWKMPGLADARRELRASWEKRILNARPLTPEEVAFPEHRHACLDTQDAFEKAKLTRFYGKLDADLIGRHSKGRASVIRRYALTALDQGQFLRVMRVEMKGLEVAEAPRRAKPFLQAELLRLTVDELMPSFERTAAAWEEAAGAFYRRYRRPAGLYLPALGNGTYLVWISKVMALMGGKKRKRSEDYVKYVRWSFDQVAGDAQTQIERMLVIWSESQLFETNPPSVLDIA